MEFITALQKAFEASVGKVLENSEVQAESLSEMEISLKGMLHQIGKSVMAAWLERQDAKYPADHLPCACGGHSHYERRRAGMSITLHGRLTYRRAYYVCPTCHRGLYPLDRRLGITPGQMSEEVIKAAALLGVNDAFMSGREQLWALTGLELSSNSVRHACQQVGEAVLAQEASWHAQSQSLAAQGLHPHQPCADHPKRLYGSLDGTYVLLDSGWHELKVGVWWMEASQQRQVCYYTDLLPASEFSELVWTTGFHYAAHQTQELIFVADGAEWIWLIVQRHFPQAIQIVDWYHASAYLAPIAQAAFADATPAQEWLQQARSLLWHGHLAALFGWCRSLMTTAPEAVSKALSYFAHNRTRLRYDRFRARGFQIGSGVRESACKQISMERLKIAVPVGVMTAHANWQRHGQLF